MKSQYNQEHDLDSARRKAGIERIRDGLVRDEVDEERAGEQRIGIEH